MQNTSYVEIIELVLSLASSYKIDDIYINGGEENLIAFFIPYFKIAFGELENTSYIKLPNMDDELQEFDSTISIGNQLIIAKYMLIGYLSKETYNIMQMQLHLQDGDFKTYAEKNNLDGKLNALYMLKEEVGYDVKKSDYKGYEW